MQFHRDLRIEKAGQVRIEEKGVETVPMMTGNEHVGISDDLHHRGDFS